MIGKRKIPTPRRGGSQSHKCDDKGKQYVQNERLFTCCSKCGKIVASDPWEDIEEGE